MYMYVHVVSVLGNTRLHTIQFEAVVRADQTSLKDVHVILVNLRFNGYPFSRLPFDPSMFFGGERSKVSLSCTM